MEFNMGLESPFSLDHTLESGQLFRWQRRGEWWTGVVSGGALKLWQDGDSLRCSSSGDPLDSGFVRNYFRLDENLEEVLASITKDSVITQAVQKFYGLRIVNQDRWECLASFVLATNANIPRIKKMVDSVCGKYGQEFEFEGIRYHAFPQPQSISSASIADLRACGLGYRAPFLKHVATSLAEGKIDFTRIAESDYESAKNQLLMELFGEKVLLGVGPKVADCVLLYSCGMDEAFPIDVWIARELSKSYPRLLGKELKKKLEKEGSFKLGRGEYEKLSKAVRAYFGRYAGYAQQYLYIAARSTIE